MEQEENKDILIVDGIYFCPKCNSKRIILHQQCVIQKAENINTGKIINPRTNKSYMSNREKAHEYDMASTDGIGCWNYECKKCGWTSGLCVE